MLLSDKRSGSTILQEEICKHPLIQHVDYTPHTYFETHHWLKAARVLNVPKEEYLYQKKYRGYGSRRSAKLYMIDCIRGNVPQFTIPADDEELVFEGWNALCSRFAQPVFFEKSPQYLAQWSTLSLILRWIESTDYEVRFIGLVRNPMSVLYSARERFFTSPYSRQFVWAQTYRNLLAMKEIVGNHRFHLVRYEDLIEEPSRSFREICRFLGLDYCKEMGRSVHTRSAKKWRDDPEFTIRLHPHVVGVGRYFGYTDEDVFNPDKPGMSVVNSMRWHIKKFYKLKKARFFDRVVKPATMNVFGRK